jgi:hypothetical protein
MDSLLDLTVLYIAVPRMALSVSIVSRFPWITACDDCRLLREPGFPSPSRLPGMSPRKDPFYQEVGRLVAHGATLPRDMGLHTATMTRERQ